MPDIEWLLLYLLLGSAVGFMSGLLGVGGGGILVPLLVSLFNCQGISAATSMHMALGTSLACMILSSASSTRAHAARGLVVWPLVRGMVPGIVLGAGFTSCIAATIHSTYIAIFFVLFMALVSMQMFINWKPRPSSKKVNVMGLLLVGSGIGSVSALAAVGGGFLSVAYMTYKNIEIKKAIATSAAIGLAIAIAGTLGFMVSGWSTAGAGSYRFGFIYLPAFIIISISSVLAAPYGARWAYGLPESQLRKIFAVVSLVLSIKMLLTNFSL